MRSQPISSPLSCALCLLATALGGCVTQAGWVYQPNSARRAAISLPLTLAIAPFADARDQENTTYFFFCLLPAVPYCNALYHRPDAANDFHTAGSYSFRPSEDLAKAAAQEIRQVGLFREVYVTDRSLPPDAHLMLHGTIINSDWRGTRFTYGLAGDGEALWLLGLPIGTAQSTLSVKLELIEQASGKKLWTHDINGTVQTTEGLYYNFGTDFGYPTLYRDGMAEALTSLERFIVSKPAGFWMRMRAPE